ncbi:PAS domain S-box protein [Allocoleopsis franciscana]|uniref:PAS domain S-box n=1 Tax=Allocoleopsis franciscana PCC 7113 TaxID=1173027 RepID=K9W7N7_9CYAN|nr:PAS domain S-box protein [Allocoleopsis franciscana]AFZ16228.1 PAS domain S-box [Allocoleopsis franciscana PCC 7113]
MDSVLQQLLSLRQIEYLVVDRQLNILETSLGVKKFADFPQEVKPTKPLCLGFPELVGVEDILIAILEGRKDSFELKGIGRLSVQGHPLYVDLYVLKPQNTQDLGNRLVVFVEDVTERMVLEQKLVQRSNEVSLLLEAWDSSNEYLNKIIQSLANALLVTTRSGIIKMVNQSANNLFGYSKEELMGTQISKVIVESNLLLEASQRYFLAQEFSRDIEVVGLTKQGTQVAIAFSCSAIQTNRENIPDYIYVGRAISKR